MKKGVSFVWDDVCQKAFEDIKEYLTSPLVLVGPVFGKPFLLYIRAMDHSLGALLAQKSDEGYEQAIYYLSWTLIGAESSYNPIEKECLVLVFAVQKTRHYLFGQAIQVVSRINPLRVLVTNPGSLNSRLAKWKILMSQYAMTFVSQKTVKCQAIADFLAAHSVPETSKLYEDIPDEVTEANMTSDEPEVWQLFFDGASRTGPLGRIVAGAGIVFISPHDHVLPRAYSLIESCSNNVAEYNALLIGLQIAKELGIQYSEAYGDSKLVVNQVTGEYEVRHEDLILYHQAVLEIAGSFDGFYIDHVPRLKNTKADVLAALAATLALPTNASYHITVATRQLFFPKYDLRDKEVHAHLDRVRAQGLAVPDY